MNLGDRATDFRFLVHDRAGQFTDSFDAVLADAGITAAKIPPQSPRAKPRVAYCTSSERSARRGVEDRRYTPLSYGGALLSGDEFAESLHRGGDSLDRALHGLFLLCVEAGEDPSADEAGGRDVHAGG
jgi:hypothetical protein